MANKPCARACPSCKEHKGRVIDSREDERSLAPRRRYQCQICKFRWTTYEISEKNFKMFLGLREAFRKAQMVMTANEELQLNQGEEDGREEERQQETREPN